MYMQGILARLMEGGVHQRYAHLVSSHKRRMINNLNLSQALHKDIKESTVSNKL